MTQCASVCLLVIFGKSQLFVGYPCLLISNQLLPLQRAMHTIVI